MSSSKSRSVPSKISGRVPRGSPDSESNSTHSKTSSDKSAKLVERKSSKITTTNNKNTNNHNSTVSEKRAVTKGSGFQLQLSQAQVDLEKAKVQLAMAEDAKSRALEELREMKKMAEEANLRLSEALLKQKHVQENSEIEKLRFDELEKASINPSQKREQAWQLELEALHKQRDLDSVALLAAKQDLERVNKELSVAVEAKALAVNQVKDARKMADANAKKIQDLSAELIAMKESLDSVSDSRVLGQKGRKMRVSKQEMKASDAAELASQSNLVIESLRKEIEKTKGVEILSEKEILLEKLNLELSSARDSGSKATSSLWESKERIQMLEKEIETAKESESKAFESMISLTKQLEETKMSLEEAKLEISCLREKMEVLEASVMQGNNDLEISYHHLEKAKIDLHNMGGTVESLKLELEITHSDLVHARERESFAVSNMQALTEEGSLLREELRLAIEAEVKSKKALDDLAMVFHEVTDEVNQVKAELESTQEELKNLKSEPVQHKLNADKTEDKVQLELNEARKEIECLAEVIEKARLDAEDSISCWNEKEMGFINCIKLSEEEIATKKRENSKLIISLREAEEGAMTAEKEKRRLMDSVRQAEAEASEAREAFELVNVENSRLRDALSEVEKELKSAICENDCLKDSETAAHQKVDRLIKLLDAVSVQDTNRSGSLSSKMNHHLLDDETISPENYGIEGAWKMKLKGAVDEPRTSPKGLYDSKHIKLPSPDEKTYSALLISLPPKSSSEDSKNKELILDPVNINDLDDMTELDDFEPQYESIDKISELSPSRMDDGEVMNLDDYDHVDGPQLEEIESNKLSPTNQKKKKALLRRFGDLLKKKGNHK